MKHGELPCPAAPQLNEDNDLKRLTACALLALLITLALALGAGLTINLAVDLAMIYGPK